MMLRLWCGILNLTINNEYTFDKFLHKCYELPLDEKGLSTSFAGSFIEFQVPARKKELLKLSIICPGVLKLRGVDLLCLRSN